MRDLVSAVILLGVLQGAVLAPVLWTRRANRLANQVFAVLVGAVALMLLSGDLERRWAFSGHPHLLGLGAPLPFLFGPLFYLYAIALTRPVLRFDPRWLWHALPFLADVLYMVQAFYLKTGAEKIALARAGASGAAPTSFYVVHVLGVVQALVYLFLTWRALERYGKKMQGYFSDLHRIDLRWLKILVLTHVGVWFVVLVSAVLRWSGKGAGVVAPLVPIGSSFAIFLTAYVSLWQPELAQKASAARVADEEDPRSAEPPAPSEPEPQPDPAPARPPPLSLVPPPTPKYQRNRLDDAEARELVAKLQALMEGKRLYAESGLTLPVLADELGVTPHTLSQLLNVHIGKSFFVFVNTYRAEALKAALTDASKAGRGVLELAFDVGFSSKSTVNSFFKKHTGMTPTEFRAQAPSAKSSQNSAA